MINTRSSNLQAPSSRETSNFKFQTTFAPGLVLGGWNFSGAWRLMLGAFDRAHDFCHNPGN
jgi:hypothetical protein